jgi:enoyl-CoA hydratase/carnithine racemase
VSSREAVEIGLANVVLPDDGFIDHVIEWLQPIARNTRASLAAAKSAVVRGLRLPFDEGLRLEGQLFIELQTSKEALDIQDRTLESYRAGGDPI